jgi:glycosyltransferase involved in cell wall biosynthesis
MRILFLTQYFPPETGACQNRLGSLAQCLSEAGHQITVLTAMPNYPTGTIFPSYRGRLSTRENLFGAEVVHTWLYASKSRGFAPRLLSYFSFMATSIVAGAAMIGPQDVVFTESPPLFLGIAGLLISRLKGARFVFNVSDLWPESAVTMGMVRNPQIIAAATWLEEFLYRHADLITGQTQGIIDDIARRFPEKPLELVTNGVQVSTGLTATAAAKARVRMRAELGLEQPFVVGYTGLHGMAQGLPTLIEAAERLTAYPEIVFAFFGDGPDKQTIVQMATERKLDNVRFFPPFPVARVPEIMAALDASIVPLKRSDLYKGALPAKLFESMGAGLPIVLAIEGEARELVTRANAGLCVTPEDPEALAAAVLELYRTPGLGSTLGRNARTYVTQHYDRARIAERFERRLLEITGCQDTLPKKEAAQAQ